MGIRCCSCLSNEQKFYFVIVLVSTFFVVEITTGYICNSLALISDAFHMLSDLIAHIVGLCAIRISKMQSKSNTFGWVRAEVMGALVNAVFMLAVCLTIVLESIERFLHLEEIERPVLLLIVGAGGLLINIIAFFLFISGEGGHGHSHGGGLGHGHSHGGGGHSHGHSHGGSGHGHSHGSSSHGHSHDDGKDKKKKKHNASASQMNISAVLRHVIGDAMGSVIVVVVAVLIWQFHGVKWILYLDPVLSLCLVIAMSSSTFPLLREASQVLMQQAPPQYEMTEFRQRLLKKVHELGVESVHEFHVWRLAGTRIIASIHISCHDISNFMETAKSMRQFFHAEGIHSVTIQPEVKEGGGKSRTGESVSDELVKRVNNKNGKSNHGGHGHSHSHAGHGHGHSHDHDHEEHDGCSELDLPCTDETDTPSEQSKQVSTLQAIIDPVDNRCQLTCSPDLKCQLVTCCPPPPPSRTPVTTRHQTHQSTPC